jgi:hypothetical protein
VGVSSSNIFFEFSILFQLAFQDSIIFNMTLRENIAFNDAVTDESLAKAIETAELGEFIASLPDGLDTVVSERGTSLSGGEGRILGTVIGAVIVGGAHVKTIVDDAPLSEPRLSHATVCFRATRAQQNRDPSLQQIIEDADGVVDRVEVHRGKERVPLALAVCNVMTAGDAMVTPEMFSGLSVTNAPSEITRM